MGVGCFTLLRVPSDGRVDYGRQPGNACVHRDHSRDCTAADFFPVYAVGFTEEDMDKPQIGVRPNAQRLSTAQCISTLRVTVDFPGVVGRQPLQQPSGAHTATARVAPTTLSVSVLISRASNIAGPGQEDQGGVPARGPHGAHVQHHRRQVRCAIQAESGELTPRRNALSDAITMGTDGTLSSSFFHAKSHKSDIGMRYS